MLCGTSQTTQHKGRVTSLVCGGMWNCAVLCINYIPLVIKNVPATWAQSLKSFTGKCLDVGVISQNGVQLHQALVWDHTGFGCRLNNARDVCSPLGPHWGGGTQGKAAECGGASDVEVKLVSIPFLTETHWMPDFAKQTQYQYDLLLLTTVLDKRMDKKCRRMKLYVYHTPHTKMTPKWISITANIIKLRINWVNLHECGLTYVFLQMTPKIQ